MEFLWDSNGISMELTWEFYGAMGLLWNFYKISLQCLTDLHGISMGCL